MLHILELKSSVSYLHFCIKSVSGSLKVHPKWTLGVLQVNIVPLQLSTGEDLPVLFTSVFSTSMCALQNSQSCIMWMSSAGVCVCFIYAEETWRHCIDALRGPTGPGPAKCAPCTPSQGSLIQPNPLTSQLGNLTSPHLATWNHHKKVYNHIMNHITPQGSFSISGQMVRQVIFKHYQIFISISFWLICQTQQKYWQIVRLQRYLQIVRDVRKSMVVSIQLFQSGGTPVQCWSKSTQKPEGRSHSPPIGECKMVRSNYSLLLRVSSFPPVVCRAGL